MAFSRLSLSFPVALVAIFFCLLVCLPTETEARTCVFKCMRNVITCKRKAALVPGGSDACCEEYYQCFMDCKPDATDLPPCNSGSGKRSGSAAAGSTWERPHYKAGQPFSDFF